MKRFLALALTAALLLTPALAAGTTPFTDVAAGSWYADAVAVCYNAQLMQGVSETAFNPTGIMQISEVATLAARLLAQRNGQTIDATSASPWYQPYLLYLAQNDITTPAATKTATRQDFFSLLAAVIPQSELPAINSIQSLPDNNDPSVLMFYNAGILTGVDRYGTFNANGTLSRSECAAMIARVADPTLRQRFTLQVKPTPPSDPSLGLTYDQELAQTMAVKVNGQDVSMARLVGYLNQIIYNADYNQLRYTGQRLDWNAKYQGIDDLEDHFLNLAIQAAVENALKEQQAKALGCTVDQLAQTMTPNPSQEVLAAFAQGMDYLAAKHILICTVDPNSGGQLRTDAEAKAIADAVLAGLEQSPTRQQFENLLTLYNEDPGMGSNPEGYLFTAGQMVPEFEAAVRGLSIGAYTSQPVKSDYGYHIILRLDPLQLTELKTTYQEHTLAVLLENWMDTATVTLNQVMLDQLKVKDTYEAYLQSRNG